MSSDNDQYRALIQLLLPQEIFEYFTLQKLEVTENKIHAFLDEENNVPEGHVLVLIDGLRWNELV